MNETPPPLGLTPQQKRVVLVLAGLAAVLFVVLVVALLVRDDPDDSIVADATTTTTMFPAEETSTTVDLPSSTTAAPTTTTKPVTTTSTTVAPKPVIDGRGAVLAPPSTATRREVSGSFCDALADPGWTAECGAFKGRDKAELAWVVERKDGGLRARVFRHGQGKQWSAVLEARDDTGSRFSDVNVRVIDVSGDGTDEAVFGFHQQGTANVLSVDVVEGPGTVVVHRDAPKGSARLSTGQLDLWEAAGSQYDHLTIRVSQGAWRIVANVKVSAGDVPPSQL